MRLFRILTLAAGLAACLAAAIPAHAAGDDLVMRGCYSKIEQRALLARHDVIPLSQAIRALRPDQQGEILRARLCRGPKGGPAYVLTVLSHNGKVNRITVDASNGTLISGR
jgi:uncharacterized membrane protein YkoI